VLPRTQAYEHTEGIYQIPLNVNEHFNINVTFYEECFVYLDILRINLL
jgi:hypothetical protein